MTIILPWTERDHMCGGKRSPFYAAAFDKRCSWRLAGTFASTAIGVAARLVVRGRDFRLRTIIKETMTHISVFPRFIQNIWFGIPRLVSRSMSAKVPLLTTQLAQVKRL